MNGKRVYVSGPMTGIEDLNRPAFHAAATDLRSQGFQVINPAECHINGGTWADYMRMDLTMMLDDCDTIYVLPGWHHSKEARLEVAVAHQLGMPVLAYPEGIHLVEDIRVHTNHDEFTAALKRTSPTTEQATAALQKFINGTHSLHVPPMIDDPDMVIGRVIDERDELKLENQRLLESSERWKAHSSQLQAELNDCVAEHQPDIDSLLKENHRLLKALEIANDCLFGNTYGDRTLEEAYQVIHEALSPNKLTRQKGEGEIMAVKIVMFNNHGKTENVAVSLANEWLQQQGDRIDVIQMDTSASMAATPEGGIAMYYITILYRERSETTTR